VVVNSEYIDIPVTGGWQTWQTVSKEINLVAGICTIRVKIIQPEFNLNWFKFTESSFGINENGSSGFGMYPNPAKDAVTIIFSGSTGQKKTILIRSSNGVLMKTIKAANTELSKEISIGDLMKGLYIVEIESASLIKRQKLIVL